MKNWKHNLAGVMMACVSLTAVGAPQELDKIVTIVNNGVVLQSDLDNMIDSVTRNASAQGQQLPPRSILAEQILQQQIVELLQVQEAERFGIRVDDNTLDQAISAIAEEHGKTVTQFRQFMDTTDAGYAGFREQIRRELTAAEARNALVRRRINILPQEVESLAQRISDENQSTVQYDLRDIQLRFPDNATKEDRDAVLAQAIALIERINNGDDFAQLAMSYSSGSRALQGGSWGWLSKDEMPTVFADEIKFEGKGDIVGPFRSGVGYHILKIDDVKGQETVSVTEVEARHILLKTSIILSDEGAQRQLSQVRDEILSGETRFADAAAKISADPGSAANEGSLGWQTPELYVPEFKEMVETLPLGQISQPFKTVHGWHIVEVMGRRDVDRTDAAFQNQAYRILFNRKFNEEAQNWLQELQAAAYIEQLGDDDV